MLVRFLPGQIAMVMFIAESSPRRLVGTFSNQARVVGPVFPHWSRDLMGIFAPIYAHYGHSVPSLMIGGREYFKILYAIVGSISVDVMNVLKSIQLSSKKLFHYIAVLKDVFTINPSLNITIPSTMGATIPNDVKATVLPPSLIMHSTDRFWGKVFDWSIAKTTLVPRLNHLLKSSRVFAIKCLESLADITTMCVAQLFTFHTTISYNNIYANVKSY